MTIWTEPNDWLTCCMHSEWSFLKRQRPGISSHFIRHRVHSNSVKMFRYPNEWEKTLSWEMNKEKGMKNRWVWLDAWDCTFYGNIRKRGYLCVCMCVAVGFLLLLFWRGGPLMTISAGKVYEGEKQDLSKAVFQYFVGWFSVTDLWKTLSFGGFHPLAPTRGVAPEPHWRSCGPQIPVSVFPSKLMFVNLMSVDRLFIICTVCVLRFSFSGSVNLFALLRFFFLQEKSR